MTKLSMPPTAEPPTRNLPGFCLAKAATSSIVFHGVPGRRNRNSSSPWTRATGSKASHFRFGVLPMVGVRIVEPAWPKRSV